MHCQTYPLPRCDQVGLTTATFLFHTSPGPFPHTRAPKRTSSSKTKTHPFTLYKTPKLGEWQYFIAAWFLFWWFGMEWRTLVRAWAGVWWVLRFALYCGLFHNFSCLTDKYLKAWRPLPLPWKKQNKTPKPKTSPWQREWLCLVYWSIKAETNVQQLRAQGRACLQDL